MIKRDKLQQLQKDSVKGKFVIDNQIINPTLTYDAPTSRFVLENETVQSLTDSGVLAIQTGWNTIVNGISQMMAAAYQAPEEYKKGPHRSRGKADTFTQALVNEAVVSYLGDLDNKSDEENDDDDEDKDEEDNEDPASTSGHQGPDDDDNDDADLPSTGPFGGASTDPHPPSASHTDPLASIETDVDHPHDTRAAGGQQDTTALVTYKKRSAALVSSISKEMAISTDLVPSTRKEMAIRTMVSSTNLEMAKSTTMVPSSKEKEKAIIGSTNFFNVANPWLYKEFRLGKQLQLKLYLQADDMYSDMKRLVDLYSGVLDRVSEITVDSTVKDVNPCAKQLTIDKIKNVGLQVEMLVGHKPQYECIQQDAVSSKPILRQLNWDVIFHVHVDASRVAMGAILAQPDGKADYPVYFANRRPLGIIILDQQGGNQGRLIGWMMFLMEFEFKVFHKPRKSHCGADYLFRNTEGNEPDSLRDESIDAELFQTTAATVEELDLEWMEVQEFLQSGKIPEGWSNSKKKGLIVKS
ncbi:hypothetical protein L7F22_021358 [Adiantum nelumboides]|nr:hypothetical protein [Adiantum nelumboides]